MTVSGNLEGHDLPDGENENDYIHFVLWDESVSDAGGGACRGNGSEASAVISV